MKSMVGFLICAMVSCFQVFCQSVNLIKFFPPIELDSINTLNFQAVYYQNAKVRGLPDKVALKYFFNNKEEDMFGTEQGFNVDNNTYTTTSYKIQVIPLFSVKCKGLYLLSYGINSVLYISMYDFGKDTIFNSNIISDFSDEMGNNVIHSILFKDYIVTTEIGKKVYYKLYKIDCDAKKFKLLKSIERQNINVQQDIIFNEALKYLSIINKGILNQP